MPSSDFLGDYHLLQELPFHAVPTLELPILLSEKSDFDELLFNPLSLNNEEEIDTVPHMDNKMQSVLNNCKYVYPDKLSKSNFNHDQDTNTCSSFSVLNLNIRSMQKNFNDLSQLLALNNISFDVIALTETWLNESNEHMYTLDGYNSLFLSRKNRTGGGVGFLYQKHLTLKNVKI